MVLRTLIASAIIALCCNFVYAQNRDPQTDNPRKTRFDNMVDQAARAYFADGKAVGLTISITRDGKSFTYHYGQNVKGSGRLPSDDLYYNIGSVAKTFVGTLLAQAVIDKRVALNDDIRKYLPGKYPNLEYQAHPVTVVELANHTSALPATIRPLLPKETDSLSKLDFYGQARFLSQYNADSLLADLHYAAPDTIPGSRYHYNTNAVMLLQLILERAYHQSYSQLITAYLRKHLKMYRTTPQLSAQQLKHTAQGYTKDGKPQHYVNIGGYFIGPNMNAAMSDLLLYLKAQVAETDPAIRLSHQLTWGKPDGFAMGLTWMIDTVNGVRYWYHDGNTKLGFNSLCTIYPSRHLGIFIIVNDVQSQEKVGRLENALYQSVVKEPSKVKIMSH